MPATRPLSESPPPMVQYALEGMALGFLRSRQSKREQRAFLKECEVIFSAWEEYGTTETQRAAGRWFRRALPVLKAEIKRT